MDWLFASLLAKAVNEQFGYEYSLNYPFANSFSLENAFTYSSLPGTSYDYSAILEW
jgi:hypothetical protein